MKKEVRKIVRLTNSQGVEKDINPEDILNMHITQSIIQYADTFDIVLDNAQGKNSKLCESKDEVEVWAGYEGTELKKMMGGYIDRIIFKKDEKSSETMQLQGRSYASILLDTRISKRMRFTKGYSEVLREILKDTPLKIDGIVDTKGEGEIIVTNAFLIDIVRQFAEDIGWTFRTDYGRVFHFKPFSPPDTLGPLQRKILSLLNSSKNSMEHRSLAKLSGNPQENRGVLGDSSPNSRAMRKVCVCAPRVWRYR